MGSDKARKRRARQLEAQFEKKSMRRAHFSLGGGVSKEKHARAEEGRERHDDGMTNALRKMLSMKEGKKGHYQRGAERSYQRKKEQRQVVQVDTQKKGNDMTCVTKGPQNPLEQSMETNTTFCDTHGRSTEFNAMHVSRVTSNAKQPQGKEDGEKNKASASKLKRKAFMKSKGKRNKDDINQESFKRGRDPAISSRAPSVGEQAEQPMQATLKRRHWVDTTTPKPLTLSMKNIGSRMDSKALAALYRSSRQGTMTKQKQVATMETLKCLVKSTTADGSRL